MTQSTTQPLPGEQVISPSLLAILVCPVDKEEVRVEGSTLVCTVCGRRYPIVDGIPNMLIDEPA